MIKRVLQIVLLLLFFWLLGLFFMYGVVIPAFGAMNPFLDLTGDSRSYGIELNDVSLYRFETDAVAENCVWRGYGVDIKVSSKMRLFWQSGTVTKVLECENLCSHFLADIYEQGIIWELVKTENASLCVKIYNYYIDFWGYFREGGNFYATENRYVVKFSLRIGG